MIFGRVVSLVMPNSHYRRYVPQLEIFLGGGTAPRSPHFGRVGHTTGRRPLLQTGHGFLTVNNSRMSVLQTLVTKKQPPLISTYLWWPSFEHVAKTTNTLTRLMSPYYTKRRSNHNLMYTMDHTFGYHSKKFIRACAKSSAHALSTEFRGGNVKLLKTTVGLAR